MPARSGYSLKLPGGTTPAAALGISKRFAPLLRLHDHEAYLPESPDTFRKNAAFRESNFRGCLFDYADRSYHRTIGWQEVHPRRPEHFGIEWDAIQTESQKHFEPEGLDPTTGRNVRPRDSKNIYGKFLNRGLFLDLDPDFRESRSRKVVGEAADGKHVQATVFVDIAHYPSKGYVKVLYWFFYALNWYAFFITHEGDWEHISLIFTEADFSSNGRPSYVYFAQHNGGILVPYSRIEKTAGYRGMHPVVYVDRNGHPCHPTAIFRHRYRNLWRTWEDLQFVVDSEWSDFAGAWGRVGTHAFKTGPLGPLFKRHGDDVRLTYRQGNLYVKLPPTWR